MHFTTALLLFLGASFVAAADTSPAPSNVLKQRTALPVPKREVSIDARQTDDSDCINTYGEDYLYCASAYGCYDPNTGDQCCSSGGICHEGTTCGLDDQCNIGSGTSNQGASVTQGNSMPTQTSGSGGSGGSSGSSSSHNAAGRVGARETLGLVGLVMGVLVAF